MSSIFNFDIKKFNKEFRNNNKELFITPQNKIIKKNNYKILFNSLIIILLFIILITK